MRKLKFRAYQDGEMSYDVMCGGFEETVPTFFRSGDWIHLDQCKVMQYVGLRDKSGIEVYEGDVLKHDSTSKSVVSFKNGAFIRKYKNSNIDLLYDAYIEDGVLIAYKVIGNIYENPELIK